MRLTDAAHQDEFRAQVGKNCYFDPTVSIDGNLDRFVGGVNEAMLVFVDRSRVKPSKEWISLESWSLMDQVRQLRKALTRARAWFMFACMRTVFLEWCAVMPSVFNKYHNYSDVVIMDSVMRDYGMYYCNAYKLFNRAATASKKAGRSDRDRIFMSVVEWQLSPSIQIDRRRVVFLAHADKDGSEHCRRFVCHS